MLLQQWSKYGKIDTMKELTIIGRAEKADLPEINVTKLPVKVDTGADRSSIWAHHIKEANGLLQVIFLGPESKHYTGEVVTFQEKSFSITRVANSFGHKEVRYRVKLFIRINGRAIRGTFSLADRSNKLYPVLIGRSLLSGKFLVDVTKGSPLIKEERARKRRLEKELIDIKGGDK